MKAGLMALERARRFVREGLGRTAVAYAVLGGRSCSRASPALQERLEDILRRAEQL